MNDMSDAEQCLRASDATWLVTESGGGPKVRWLCSLTWHVFGPPGIASAQRAISYWQASRSAAITQAVAQATAKGWKP